MTCTRSATRNNRFCRNGNSNHRSVGGHRRLHDAVQVEKSISVGGDILGRNGKDGWSSSSSDLHDAKEVFAHPQNIPFLHRRRDGKTSLIDDPIPFGGIKREN